MVEAGGGATGGVRGRLLRADLSSRLRSSARALPGAGAGNEEEVGVGGGGGAAGGNIVGVAGGGLFALGGRDIESSPDIIATFGSFSREERERPIIEGGATAGEL